MDGLQPLIDFVAKHPRLLVITGAGCSTAAGIPDYRDENGAWKRREPMRYQLFVGDTLARRRYWARSMLGWSTMACAQPTTAHDALAQLERAGRIIQLVTQNVAACTRLRAAPTWWTCMAASTPSVVWAAAHVPHVVDCRRS